MIGPPDEVQGSFGLSGQPMSGQPGVQELAKLIGATPGGGLPAARMAKILSKVANAADPSILDTFFTYYKDDRKIIPSTSVYMALREGHLAIISNRLRLFRRPLLSDSYKHDFSLTSSEYSIKWQGPSGIIMYVVTHGKTYRMSLMSLEKKHRNSGFMFLGDIVNTAANIGALPENYAKAKANKESWEDMFALLRAGRSYPFS